jgi:hypothetical protein
MIVIYRQINFINNKNLGFAKEDLLYMPLEGPMAKNFMAFKEELLKQPGIKIFRVPSSPLEVEAQHKACAGPGKILPSLSYSAIILLPMIM